MSEEKNDEVKEKSFLNLLVIPIATALIVGGTAPWWVDLIKGNPQGSTSDPQLPSVSNSGSRQASEDVATDDSINIQGSGNAVTDDSVIASDGAVIQQNRGSGSNISAGGDVNINQPFEVPRFEGQIQHYNLEEQPIGEFEGSKKFLEFITENDQKVVYLNIWPYYPGGRVNLDTPTEIFIPAPDGAVVGWTAYEILDSENGDFFYDPTFDSRIIKGYFKVIAVYPYVGGGQRIRLKSVAIEDVPR